MRIALLVVALALLVGWEETRFESPLGDNIETCDARWKGLWMFEDHDPKGVQGISVDDACRVIVLDQPEVGGPIKQVHVPINFVHIDKRDFVVISDAQLNGLVDLPAPYAIKPPPAKSFVFVRYRARGDRLEIDTVDTSAVAKLILDRKLDGTISRTESETHVFVRGDRARMLEIVRHERIFADKTSATFVRRKQSLADFERELETAAPKEKR